MVEDDVFLSKEFAEAADLCKDIGSTLRAWFYVPHDSATDQNHQDRFHSRNPDTREAPRQCRPRGRKEIMGDMPS